MAARTEKDAEGCAPLSRERVLLAAVALADDKGIAALSMRRLAEGLGVEAMSLYHHVANKEAILDGMIDVVFGEIDLTVGKASWREAMRRRAASARQALMRHPWAVGLMESRRNPGPATLRHHDAVLGILRRGGFSVAKAAHAFSLLDSYVYGFAMQELALPFRAAEDLQAMAGDMLAQGVADAYPYMAEMIVQHVLLPGYAYADEFEVGLELVLEGLQRMLDAG